MLIKRKKNILSKEQKLEVKNIFDLGKITKTEIKNKFNISHQYLYNILKSFNIKVTYRNIDRKRKYVYNKDYFKVIDHQDKAYWLGWLMSDGYISNKKSNRTIGLTITDKEIIEMFIKCIEGNMPVRVKHYSHKKTSYTLLINNKEMINDLEKYGIIPNKTNRTIIPELDDVFIHHFIRAYFDGDGCLYINNNRASASITSASFKILKLLEEYLKEKNIIRKNKDYIKTYPTWNYGTFQIDNKEECLKFLDFIYENANLKLLRKYNKYIELKNRPFRIKRTNCKSKYFGVTIHKYAYHKKYTASMRLNKKNIFIGNFFTEKEAAIAYNNKILELGLNKQMLNKIDD